MNQWQILLGDVRETLATLPTGSVQCCVTSPPYWGLRDYGAEGQLGLEPTPDAYVANMVGVFLEVRRVLKDDGTLWLNLGDSYAGSSQQGKNNLADSVHSTRGGAKKIDAETFDIPRAVPAGMKPKDLVGIPWMVAFALRADGWYLRSDIIWHKPNPMPESVTDRPTKAHEYLFLLTKSARYYYDAAAIAEECTPHMQRRAAAGHTRGANGKIDGSRQDAATLRGEHAKALDVSGRNKRSVWTVATQPYSGAHFATFPEALIEPCILAGTSEKGQCPACGQAWERVTERTASEYGVNPEQGRRDVAKSGGALSGGTEKCTLGHGGKFVGVVSTVGWQPTCDCNAGDPVSQTVLDPFNGSGTTGAVSVRHQRNYIGCELNPAYIELARTRIGSVAPMFAREVA
jgi:DNA modification methylase